MRYDTKEFEKKIQKTLANLEETLSTIRASLANTAVISKVCFEYYGADTRIMDMASVAVTDARTITITPYDQKTLGAMKKALLASDVGITPVDDGRNIRLVFPQLSEERRKELVKQIQKLGEDAKVAIRNLRRNANDEIKKQKKDGILTEDDQKDAEKNVQEITDKNIKTVDVIVEKKTREIMKV